MSPHVCIPLSLLLAACMATGGCSRTGQEQGPARTEGGSSPPLESEGTQRHVYLSSTELAIELQEHCAAANEALNAAATELSGSRRPNLNQARAKVAEAQKKMDYCLKMAHGIAESTLGTAAEKGPSQK